MIYKFYFVLRTEFYFYFVKVLLKPYGFSYILFASLTVQSTIPLGARRIKLKKSFCKKQKDFLAERKGFEPLCLLGKRFSRPPRYDHFDTSPCLTVWYYITSDISMSSKFIHIYGFFSERKFTANFSLKNLWNFLKNLIQYMAVCIRKV